jgi:hypothetical protein
MALSHQEPATFSDNLKRINLLKQNSSIQTVFREPEDFVQQSLLGFHSLYDMMQVKSGLMIQFSVQTAMQNTARNSFSFAQYTKRDLFPKKNHLDDFRGHRA